MKLGKRLRLLMLSTDQTQESLAERSGVSVGTVSNMMRDVHRPRPENVAAVAGALDVPRDALEDDRACVRELARLCGVREVRVGPPTAASGELAELLATVPPERARDVANLVRGMLGLLSSAPSSAPSVAPRPEPPSSRHRPSPGRPAGEGEGGRR